MIQDTTQGQKQTKTYQPGTGFTVAERGISCPYKVQFYMDWGTTDMGPWLKVGLNNTELGVGYLPKAAPAVNLAAVQG